MSLSLVARVFAATALSVSVLVPRCEAQVTVAPTFLAVEASRPLKALMVINQGTVAQEVKVAFRFGYSVSDSTGSWQIQYEEDGPVGEAYSAQPWLRVFPERFVLEAGERQTVRVMAQPPADLADGAYWTRLSVVSHELAPLAAASAPDAISARINIIFEQTLPVVVQRGQSETGLALGEGRARVDSSTVRLVQPTTRTGPSPFFGRIDVRVFDASGSEVHRVGRSSSVYFDFVERVDFDTVDFPPGEYRAELTFRPGRTSVSEERLPAMHPVTATIPFSVPSPD